MLFLTIGCLVLVGAGVAAVLAYRNNRKKIEDIVDIGQDIIDIMDKR